MSVKISGRISLFAASLVSLTFLASGCSLSSGSQKIHQTAQGSVYLETVSDWSFEADHPTMIDQQTMLKIVKGLHTDEASMAVSKLSASGSKPMRVFSDEDAGFLAPLLAQGLSQAKPEQIVGFRVSPSAGSDAEPTAGTLYVHHGAIYVTFTAPKHMNKVAGFLPRSIARIEAASPSVAQGSHGTMSIAIDYQALTKASVSSALSTSAQHKPVDTESVTLTTDELLRKKTDELRQAKETAALKESEIRVLRKENDWMKEKLRERTAQLNAIKANTSKTSSKQNTKKTVELQPIP